MKRSRELQSAAVRWASTIALAAILAPMVWAQTPPANTHKPIHIVPMTTPQQQSSHSVVSGASGHVSNGVAGAHLNYYGGPVQSNVNVVVVFWGSSVNSTTVANIVPFFTALSTSAYLSELNEYTTTGATVTGGGSSTNQTIGQGSGTVAGYTITPANTATTIDDTAIQSELISQISAGHLPTPQYDSGGNPNSLYMIYFPVGMTITQNGSTSCVQFCAYHGTSTYSSKPLIYGILPDIGPTSACSGGCGNSATTFNNLTSVSSHEWAEAITDADVGFASVYGPPLAWYDPQGSNGEIGDICNGVQASGPNSGGYTVQLEWSNIQGKCADGPAYFTLTATSPENAGALFPVTVSAFNTAGGSLSYSRTVHWTSSDPSAVLPADGALSSSPYSVTLNTPGTQTITVTDAALSSITGSTTITVDSVTPTSTTMTATPNPANGGATVTLTATVRVTNSQEVPTGQVQFQDNATNLGAAVTMVNGQASIGVSSLASGLHSLTANYLGGAYSPSISPGFPEVINATGATPNTVTVQASPTTSVDNGNVTFTATLNAAGASGWVLFEAVSGSTTITLGAPAVSGGTASVLVTSLKPGAWTIRASYSGDSTYQPSVGTVLHVRQRKMNVVRSSED